jgi:hypothetical protein
MQVALSQRMEIGEGDNIGREMKLSLPSRVAAILKECPIVLQGNSATVTIDPEDGRRSGVRLGEQAEVTRSIQIYASIDVDLALSWERESPYNCSELNGKLAETCESIESMLGRIVRVGKLF